VHLSGRSDGFSGLSHSGFPEEHTGQPHEPHAYKSKLPFVHPKESYPNVSNRRAASEWYAHAYSQPDAIVGLLVDGCVVGSLVGDEVGFPVGEMVGDPVVGDTLGWPLATVGSLVGN
jgi:hypothetical protein